VSLDDPVALSAMALVTYGSGIGAFVLHTGPGVRGGGEADLARGRHRNLWELPTVARIAEGLSAITKLMPGDFANWDKHDGLTDDPDRPVGVRDRTAVAGVYCFAKNPEFACAVVGIKKPLALVARRKVTASVHQLVGGSASTSKSFPPGSVINIPVTPPSALIRGRLE
jgi:hypothetical protein